MPTSIPYDPALVMGNLVPQALLDNLLQIADLQQPIDTLQFELNERISLKNSMKATMLELADMGVDTKQIEEQSEEVSKEISLAAINYAKTRIEQEKKMQGLRSKIVSVHASEESPVDWVRTQIANRPLSSDSMKLDIQYFSFDENEQSASNSISSMKSFLTATFGGGFLSESNSTDIAHSAMQQVTRQRERHDIAGTLVLSASCTHKNAVLLAPFILDVDKAIRVWNAVYTDEKDKINVMNMAALEKIKEESNTAKEKTLPLISGATYGSSFVGMVHVLKKTSTQTDQSIASVTNSLQTQFELGLWFADMQGSFGVESTIGSDIKNLLSTASVDSHVSLLTTGIIPSLAANEIETTVKQFTSFDPAEMMTQLAVLANSTQSDHKTMQKSASDARTGQQLVEWQNQKIKSVVGAVGDIATVKDKIINVQSMITAFEDYVRKAMAGEIGVPINYFIKHITKSELAQMWLSKYYPRRFMAISGDDSGNPPPVPGHAPASEASSSEQASGDDSNSASADDGN